MSIATAVAVVGTVLGAKAMIDGIKEGNLLGAALGGLGAYMGMSSLGAFGSAGSTAGGSATVAGTTGGSTAASNAAMGADQFLGAAVDSGGQLAAEVANTGAAMDGALTTGAAQSGSTSILDSLASGAEIIGGADIGGGLSSSMFDSFTGNVGLSGDVASGGMFDIFNTSSGLLDGATDSINATGSDGLWGSVKDGFSDASDFVSDNKDIVGMGMKVGGGLLQGMAQEDLQDEKWQREDDKRRRKGATPNAKRIVFNPQTKRMEYA